jgi:hypothetical protein
MRDRWDFMKGMVKQPTMSGFDRSISSRGEVWKAWKLDVGMSLDLGIQRWRQTPNASPTR